MNRQWRIGAVLMGLAWVCLRAAPAQAAGIPPTDPATLLLTGGNVTLALYQDDRLLPAAVTTSAPSRCTTTGTALYREVTDCWLPEWDPASGGKPVYVVVTGSASAPTLVPPGITLAPGAGTNLFLTNLTTSAYPGKCTNIGGATDADYNAADFTFDPTPIQLTTSVGAIMGYKLTPNDCGGMAVIQVGTSRFILPRDGAANIAANGIPEVWENLHGGNLSPAGDGDTGPGATALAGDGISTFDEYRGFIVSGKQVRTDPRQKDLFVHLVNPQPWGSTSLLAAGGYPAPTVPNATLTPPGAAATLGAVGTYTADAAVFSNANTLGEIIGTGGLRARITAVLNPTTVTAQTTQASSGTSLPPGSWQLSESVFGGVYGMYTPERVRLLGYAPGAANPNTTEWVDNFDSYSALGGLKYTAAGSASDRVVNVNRVYGEKAQKGIRVIESVDVSSSSPYGWTFGGAGSPNAIGNVVIYTQRIINQITLLISNGGARKVQYSPMSTKSTDWTPKTLVGSGSPTDPAVKNFIISKALQFYVGHEVGHSSNLNLKTSTPPHFAAGTGDELDLAITTKLDKSTGGFNTFYIPSLYGTSDQSVLLLK
jgi:hypothetical protein